MVTRDASVVHPGARAERRRDGSESGLRPPAIVGLDEVDIHDKVAVDHPETAIAVSSVLGHPTADRQTRSNDLGDDEQAFAMMLAICVNSQGAVRSPTATDLQRECRCWRRGDDRARAARRVVLARWTGGLQPAALRLVRR